MRLLSKTFIMLPAVFGIVGMSQSVQAESLLLAPSANSANVSTDPFTDHLASNSTLVDFEAPMLGGRKGSAESKGGAESLRAAANIYQLGDEWGKKKVTTQLLADASDAFKRSAYATAKVGGATGFYLGTFNGHHVMATNHHVFEDSGSCLGRKMNYPLINKSFKCNKFFGSWKDIDLALFAIDVPNTDDLKELELVGRNFNFKAKLEPGMPLVTIGFGTASNPLGALMGNEDSDCKVFSAATDFRFMPDPDKLNPGPYKAWSFANGCDVSHGDSGSAMVDRANGDVVGIIWTGRIPKSKPVQKSSHLDGLLKNQSADIWEELSYAVPAPKILDFLNGILNDGDLNADTAATLKALTADSAN